MAAVAVKVAADHEPWAVVDQGTSPPCSSTTCACGGTRTKPSVLTLDAAASVPPAPPQPRCLPGSPQASRPRGSRWIDSEARERASPRSPSLLSALQPRTGAGAGDSSPYSDSKPQKAYHGSRRRWLVMFAWGDFFSDERWCQKLKTTDHIQRFSSLSRNKNET